ncbi:MAG: hypothetical protein KAR42_13385 [candidate division Zixibacteria bacterium]|nr:hypothetical protein [candidate division Zixibacteria bacterium]
MKTRNILLTAFAILSLVALTSPAIQAQTCDGNGTNFVDLNGDGFNDNAPDHDGDGIPNGLDEDYVKNAQDGAGYQKGKLGENKSEGMVQNGTMTKSQKFNRLQSFNGTMTQKRTGAQGGMNGSGAGVCDGTGGGMNGSGVCDGTGPNGGQKRGGK